MVERFARLAKRIVIKVAKKISGSNAFVVSLYMCAKIFPSARISDYERHPLWLCVCERVFGQMRHALNNKAWAERESVARKYVIPTINTLFDKNHVNVAQLLLLTLEEYFLSKDTEEGFEEVLATFSSHAIAAGLRFRERYPLAHADHGPVENVGFVGHSVAVSGYEVVMRIAGTLNMYVTKMFACRVYEDPSTRTTKSAFADNNVDLILSDKNQYDVFALRRLVTSHNVDVAIWPMLPFHMFFIFSFGLARKQIWLSQYLRPNIAFKYLDEVVTLGGAGTISEKTFNGKKWKIVPQIVDLHSLSNDGPERKVLFTPARLEKLKQPEFMECVARILENNPDAHFKWTGYFSDEEVIKFFRKKGLAKRHTYLPWMDERRLKEEIGSSYAILACFPLSLGTVENIAAECGVPVLAMYDDEKNLYWRDVYWEAVNGNEFLAGLCLNPDGSSKISIVKTADEYVAAAARMLNSKKVADEYADIYKKSYSYTYHDNPNDIGGMLSGFINNIM